ncbi:MAG: MFS transporter [Candidatus Marinimicrobia bacterium]|nr:MFS transporter [Candidatus Neomarinimicrobiota bacterium]
MSLLRDKKIFGWVFYDWANSAYVTTVMAGFFPVFFKEYWSRGVDVTVSTAKLGFANSIAGLTVALLSPILGAIADRGTMRKKFLLFFAYLGILMCTALFFVGEGEWVFASLIYVLGVVGFSGANTFYDALLPSVADEKKIDYVSSLGFAFGYLGGGLLFAINVIMVQKPDIFGLPSAAAAVKFSFLTVAIWWLVFSIPLILWVPDRAEKKEEKYIVGGFKQLTTTFKKIRHLKVVFLFLVAYWLYIDGVDTIIRMAIDYGLSIGFESKDLILALLITQFIGFPSAIIMGKIGQRIGSKKTILICIAGYIFITVWGIMMTKKYEFYVLAILVGLFQGGIQALSRSYYSRIIPHDQLAEFYGFYNLLGKFAVILGPVLIGVTGLISKSPRAGIGSILILFIVGGILLFFVNEEKGRREVEYLRYKG